MSEVTGIARRYIEAFDEMIRRSPNTPGIRRTREERTTDPERIEVERRVSDAMDDVIRVLASDDDSMAVLLGVELLALARGSERRTSYLVSDGPINEILDHPVRGPMLRDHPDPFIKSVIRSVDYSTTDHGNDRP